jgi:hypothetical protein
LSKELFEPNDIFSRVLAAHKHETGVCRVARTSVVRFREANDKEHRRQSSREIRNAIELANPQMSAARADDVIKRQLLPYVGKIELHTGMTARDIERNSRKSMVKSRKGARRS